jgi:hypothetical protein
MAADALHYVRHRKWVAGISVRQYFYAKGRRGLNSHRLDSFLGFRRAHRTKAFYRSEGLPRRLSGLALEAYLVTAGSEPVPANSVVDLFCYAAFTA